MSKSWNVEIIVISWKSLVKPYPASKIVVVVLLIGSRSTNSVNILGFKVDVIAKLQASTIVYYTILLPWNHEARIL